MGVLAHMYSKFIPFLLTLFVLISLVACGSDKDEQSTKSLPVVKESEAPKAKAAVVVSNEDHDEDEEHDEDDKDHDHDEDEEHDEDDKDHDHSVSIIDALGQTLEFNSLPERIVTISPTATEMLYLVGGEAVGRDRASNFPEDAKLLPDVGSGYDPSIEALMAMRPDLVIVEALTQARFVPMLGKMGLTVMAVKIESVEDVVNNINAIGKVTGNQENASAAVTDIETRLEAAGKIDKSVLIFISDADRNLYAAKPSSYTGLVASIAGMENKAEGLPDSGPFPGFSMMSPEAILMANPDVIVTITPAPKPAPRLSESIKQIPPFAGLKAIQTNMVFEGDLGLFLQSPGPRIVEAVEFLTKNLNQ